MEHTVDIEYLHVVPAHDRGKFSDEHSASSYGIPVLLWKGEAYGVADLPPGTKIQVVWKKARTGPVWGLIQKAIDAGYPIEIDPVG